MPSALPTTMVALRPPLARFGLALASSLALGCAGSPMASPPGCESGKCDAPDDVEEALENLNDPIAHWLRGAEFTDTGRLVADYSTMLFDIAEQQGCDADSVKTFIVADDLVTGDGVFPRLVSTVCSDEPSKASEFFISASFEKTSRFGDATGEVDLQAIEAFAWDKDAREYHFYATEPVGNSASSGVHLEIQPTRCRGCHLTPTDMATDGMHMLPIMNEMNRPWTHWNAEPGFPSHDYHPPDRVKNSETFAELVIPFLGSASELEEVIRAGHERVDMTRLRRRRNAVDVNEAMTLLRPLFCDEQVNYVSEEFDSGTLNTAAVADPGMRAVLATLTLDESFSWMSEDSLTLPPPTNSAKPIHQVPVRGSADSLYEQRMVALKGLDAELALAVRALDWKNPVLSTTRCKLWRDASKRFSAEAPDVGDAARNSDAFPALIREIMEIDGTSLLLEDGIVAIGAATQDQLATVAAAVDDGSIGEADCQEDGFCLVAPTGLARLVQDEIDAILSGSATAVRNRLRQARDARICEVIKVVPPADSRFDEEDLPIRFANQPALPDVSCN